MPQGQYLPEGMLLDTAQNRMYTASPEGMQRAMTEGKILEGVAKLCDAEHNLTVQIGDMVGVIPRDETALGIRDGKTREIAILSRVGKPVCFRVMGCDGGVWRLSRAYAQQEALAYLLENLLPGEVIRARVTHLEPFGAFVDLGCGNVSLIGIENISVSRITHPRERFCTRQLIYAAVLSVDKEARRITLTHRELLGTWEENAYRIEAGQTVGGIVRGVEDYGVFVELTPNLSGLAERKEGMSVGMLVSVYIKSIIPQRMKVKLIIIDALECVSRQLIGESDYMVKSGRLSSWRYTPQDCQAKLVETVF